MESIINKLLESYLARIVCSKRLRNARHQGIDFLRQCARKNHHAKFYFDLDDPQSTLMLHAIEELEQAFRVTFEVIVVSTSDSNFLPEPELREKYSISDAHYLAQAWGLSFPTLIPNQRRLKPEALRVLLTHQPTVGSWIQLAKEVTEAYWHGDAAKLHKLIEQNRPIDILDIAPRLKTNTDKLRKKGFFMGSSICYGGEWYVGLDRLYLLRSRLAQLSLQEHRTLIYPDWGNVRVPCSPNDTVDLYFSFRSPYSYIAIARLMENKDLYPLDNIRLKPVMPMVTRGIPLPRSKKMYILTDAARVAHFEDIEFGWVRDPLGEGVHACQALFLHCDQDQQLSLVYTLMRDVWARGKDVSSDAYISEIIKLYSLPAEEVGRSLIEKDYSKNTDENRDALTKHGLWGVPSFVKGQLSTWGQDRMPLVFSRAFK